MTKTISQKLREHAQSKQGGYHMGWINQGIATILMRFLNHGEYYMALEMDERRTFCEFVACALESEQ
jgi:hypothetical protein